MKRVSLRCARPLISDHHRVYTDAEFALILRKATELASPDETPAQASDGLTLAEMKAAAAEVGIDPALIERAARHLPARSASHFEQLMGGPVRHDDTVRLPVTLDEARAEQLLAAVQLSAGQPGTGHSSPIGMVWHAREEGERLSVTAQPEEGGTSVAVQLDRRATMVVVQVSALLGLVGAAQLGFAIGSQVSPELGAAAAVTGMGGTFALARGYWAYSTRRVRERIRSVLDAVGQVVAKPGTASSGARAIGEGGVPPAIGPGESPDAR